MTYRHLLFAGHILIAGCTQKDRPVNHAFDCWFVISDGAGHQGYQAANFESSSATPHSQPFYKSIEELRAALLKEGMTSFVSINGYTNDGWLIRGLTIEEFKALQ